MVHGTHRSSLYFCPVGSAVRVAPRCSFLRPLLRPVSAITSPTQLPPASAPPPAPTIVDIPYSSSHRNSCFALSSPRLCPSNARRQARTFSIPHAHTSNAVQTDKRGSASTRRLASSKPANRKKVSRPTAKDGHLGCLLLFVTEQKGLRSGSLGILPACLPCTLKPHRTRHLLLSSFERLLQHINSSSCASLDYIYPTSSLKSQPQPQPQYLGPHIASPCLPTKAAPIIHLKQSSEEVVFPALPLFRSASSRPPR